jgi:hypothetical protein
MKRLFSTVMVVIFGTSLFISRPTIIGQANGNSCPEETTPGCTNGLPTDVYNKLLDQMKAHPAPEVTPGDFDKKDVWSYSFWKVLPDTQLYDAPNGNVVGKIDNGFNFVGIYKQQDGFAQLRNKQWVLKSSLKQTYASEFTGVLINQPLQFPMVWVIQASIPASVPGGVRNPQTPAIKRYTLLNIFATVHVDQWDWYLVGPGQWLEQRKVARVVPAMKPAGAHKWVAIDLFEQVLTAYEDDKLVFATLISSGLTAWQTNIGTFKVWKRVQTTAMSGAMGQPDFYSLPAVPYVMFFDNDISLHGTYWHDGFGFKHSHGCVNMSISDAHWLYDWAGSDEVAVTVWDSRNQTFTAG